MVEAFIIRGDKRYPFLVNVRWYIKRRLEWTRDNSNLKTFFQIVQQIQNMIVFIKVNIHIALQLVPSHVLGERGGLKCIMSSVCRTPTKQTET